MRPQYNDSKFTPPNVGEDVLVLVDNFRCHFPAGGEVQMTYLGVQHGSQRWNHDTVGGLFGYRLWRHMPEVVKPVWIDSRNVKPADGQTVWATMGPGEGVHAFTYEARGQLWRCAEHPGSYLGHYFWQPRVVPVQPPKPEPMPEPARTDGWIRLGAQRPADEQQVWVATVNMGVQPARYHDATEHQGVQCNPARFLVSYGPEVGQYYNGDFLLWQPRQAQPAYPIL